MPATFTPLPYRHRILGRLLLVTGCAFVAVTHAWAADVWVITDHQHPVTVAPDIRLIELDAPARIQAELPQHLSVDPKRAAELLQQRLKDDGGALQRRLAAAYQDVTDAWSLGITKIPAVVVDRRYVVYGDPDVNRALLRIEQYRRAHP
jgi:integrating conjugative element protein (TIGR03757 family)